MRVAMYYNNIDVRLEETPTPTIGPGELLVKVMASGICGSDVMEWYRVKRAPCVLGHEIAGRVECAGEGVGGFAVGDRVFVSHHVPCDECGHCLAGNHTCCETLRTTNFDPGGFAEYIRVPSLQVQVGTFKLPDELSLEDGTFIEPLGCVVRAQRAARVAEGQTLLVIGSGISGLLHVKLGKAHGARVVATDVKDSRLEVAKRSGADAAVDGRGHVAQTLRRIGRGCLADCVMICASSLAAAEQALDLVEDGGTVMLFAPMNPEDSLLLPVNDFWRRQITLTTSYGAAPQDLAESIELLRCGQVAVGDMVTHRLPLAETGHGFKLVAGLTDEDSLKVIVEPQL